MDIQNVINALQDYHQGMVDSDPTVQELRAEVERLKEELSSSTNHYNGIINDLVKLREEARAEMEQLKAEYDSSNKAFYEQIRVQKNISDAHYKSYCEMLKRVHAVVKERDEALAERDRLKTELEQVKRESVKTVTVSFPGMRSSSGGGGGGSACGNNHLPEAEKMVSPEPSRLEIAALLASGLNPCWNFSVEALFHRTDAIIAAAKEVTK